MNILNQWVKVNGVTKKIENCNCTTNDFINIYPPINISKFDNSYLNRWVESGAYSYLNVDNLIKINKNLQLDLRPDNIVKILNCDGFLKGNIVISNIHFSGELNEWKDKHLAYDYPAENEDNSTNCYLKYYLSQNNLFWDKLPQNVKLTLKNN